MNIIMNIIMNTIVDNSILWVKTTGEMFYQDDFEVPEHITAVDMEGNSWFGVFNGYRLDNDMFGNRVVRVRILKEGFSFPFEAWLDINTPIFVSFYNNI